MTLQPNFSPREPQWRGNTSSEDMNTNFEEILYDLNTIFSEVAATVMDLNNLESKIRHEAEAMNSRIYSVSGLITTYEQSASGYKLFHEDFFLTKNIAYPESLPLESRCTIDTDFGVCTLPVNNSFSKVYTVALSDGKVTISPDLTLEVVPLDETGNVRIDELSQVDAFDGDEGTVWERKVRFNKDSSKSSVSCRLDINLPSMSNPYVNRLYIKPYPEGTMDVQAITYDTLVSQDNVLPSLDTDGENNMIPTLFSFNNIQPSKIRISLRQRSSANEEDYKTFVYGAKEIGIEKAEYKQNGKIAVRFDLPSYESGLLRYITSLATNPGYDNITYKVSVYASKSDFDSDNPIWTSSNSPITPDNKLDVSLYTTESLWIMIELVQPADDSKSPLLNAITATYTTT